MDPQFNRPRQIKWLLLTLPLLAGFLLVTAVLWAAQSGNSDLPADPIEPPKGYPKFNISLKTVSPTLATVGGETLHYVIEIQNTGAYTASGTSVIDILPGEVTYNGDAAADTSPEPVFDSGSLTWNGEVGFDASVIISFSVTVSPTFSGRIMNTAVISHPLAPKSVMVTAETTVTDLPIFEIEKTSTPEKPGPNKPLTYSLHVINSGQPVENFPITVTDRVPTNTTLLDPGTDGLANDDRTEVTWSRNVSLETGQTTIFTFSVMVDNVSNGTVITNTGYTVSSTITGENIGEPYTTTIVLPEFQLLKEVWPDPPGSNREMIYNLTLLNRGSLATGLVITDRVPDGVSSDHGGWLPGDIVTWTLSSLDTNGLAEFSFAVNIDDIMGVSIVNSDYGVCSNEGVCQSGEPLTSTVRGPTFVASVELDPIAKKPGGHSDVGDVTPTITIENLGPGSAIGAFAYVTFDRISVSQSDLVAIPSIVSIPTEGSFSPGANCGSNCVSYWWQGDIGYGESVTITTSAGQTTIGGEEGTPYVATVVITDGVGLSITVPITETASGRVTHYANLIPTKSAPPLIGAGQFLTYTISVGNSGLSTEVPPSPVLTDSVPVSTTLIQVNGDGVSQTIASRIVVSWTLPAMSPGDTLQRSYVVQVFPDLEDGTQIVNDDYRTSWYESRVKGFLTNVGEPVTTTVREVGLIDSYKEVTPTLLSPGSGQILTYTVHVVNSGPHYLNDVSVYDIFPWEQSTYRRDAAASSGEIISDIVSFRWTGDVDAFMTEIITLTVLVDEGFQGVISNTAVISHADLREEVSVSAIAYVSDKPVLQISKCASFEPEQLNREIQYTILVANMGQLATNLIITDRIPAGTSYVLNSADAGGQLVEDTIHWRVPLLRPGERRFLTFWVIVESGGLVVNDDYGVSSAEGVFATGHPVSTYFGSGRSYLPLVMR